MGLVLLGVVLAALVALLLFGFVGGLAGAIVGGGREDRSMLKNAGIGLIGSLVGGTLWTVTQGGGFDPSFGGFVAALVGSIVFLLIMRMIKGRSGDSSATPEPR